MIVAERKPLNELYSRAQKHDKVLLLGCSTCVTVCMAGGEKEVGILASQITLAAREKGDHISLVEHTITRQCDREFFDEATVRKVEAVDAIISLGCGVGVQFAPSYFRKYPFIPGSIQSFTELLWSKAFGPKDVRDAVTACWMHSGACVPLHGVPRAC